MDERLKPWIALKHSQRPRTGWISAVRQALGMSAAQLARRLGVHRAAVKRLEDREMENTITLESLSRTAEALGCELVYAIVPKPSLSAIVRDQANKVAHSTLDRVGHTMQLEEQGVNAEEAAAQEASLAERLLTELPRQLWDDPKNPPKPA